MSHQPDRGDAASSFYFFYTTFFWVAIMDRDGRFPCGVSLPERAITPVAFTVSNPLCLDTGCCASSTDVHVYVLYVQVQAQAQVQV